MKIVLCLSIMLSLFGGCEQLGQEQEITRAQLDRELLKIKEFIESENCTTMEQCRYIAYGSKGCGGPQGYLLYPQGINEETLQKMVTRYTEREQTYNRQNEVISDCSLPAPPLELQCSNGKCAESV